MVKIIDIKYKNNFIVLDRVNKVFVINKIKKENLINLNNLIVRFFENFDKLVYYSLIRDLNSKKETPRTILYNQFLEESKDIFTRMQNYQLEKGNAE